MVWVSGDRLLAAGLDPWMGVPPWIGDPAWKAADRVDIRRALDVGLEFPSLQDTIRAALASAPPQQPTTFNRSTEMSLLEALI